MKKSCRSCKGQGSESIFASFQGHITDEAQRMPSSQNDQLIGQNALKPFVVNILDCRWKLSLQLFEKLFGGTLIILQWTGCCIWHGNRFSLDERNVVKGFNKLSKSRSFIGG